MQKQLPHAHPHDDVVTWLERVEIQQRGLDATRLQLIGAALEQTVGRGQAATRERELAYRSLRAELALAFNQSEHQVEAQMSLAHELLESYANTFTALEDGIITSSHCRIIVDSGAVIGVSPSADTARRRAGYEAAVLQVAPRETPNRLRPIARRLAEQWAERDIDERHREACISRRVLIVDRDDGMADLIAHMPAIEAHAIYDRLTRIARAANRGERLVRAANPVPPTDESTQNGESVPTGDSVQTRESAHTGDSVRTGNFNALPTPPRTRDQVRADAFTEILLSADECELFAESTTEAIRGQVHLIATQRHDARDGHDAHTRPFAKAELRGYGPIPRETATALAGLAPVWSRTTVDAQTQEVISVDRYRPSKEMRRLLDARDQHCRFPGCRAPTHRCDLDHTVDAAKGGPTTTTNLAHLCRSHHSLKHHTSWKVSQELRGVLRWTSPTGRSYVDRPPEQLPGSGAPRKPKGGPPGNKPGSDPPVGGVRFE